MTSTSENRVSKYLPLQYSQSCQTEQLSHRRKESHVLLPSLITKKKKKQWKKRCKYLKKKVAKEVGYTSIFGATFFLHFLFFPSRENVLFPPDDPGQGMKRVLNFEGAAFPFTLDVAFFSCLSLLGSFCYSMEKLIHFTAFAAWTSQPSTDFIETLAMALLLTRRKSASLSLNFRLRF